MDASTELTTLQQAENMDSVYIYFRNVYCKKQKGDMLPVLEDLII